MSQITHVFVTVPAGRLVPLPSSEGGGDHCEPGKVYRRPWSTFTRRRITGGDFILSNIGGTAVKTEAAADASKTGLKAAADGSVDKDQRSDDEINAAAAKQAPTFDTSDSTTGKGL